MVVNSLFCLIQRVFRSGADHPISILNSSGLAGRAVRSESHPYPIHQIGYTPPMTADPQATDTSDKPDYDSPWKEALERFFPEFLALLFSAIYAEIDWSKGVQFLDKEFQPKPI